MVNKTGIKLLVLLAVLAGVYLAFTHALSPVAVVQAVAGGPVALAVPAQIKVRAEKSLELKPEIGGRVLNDIEDGRSVKAGEVVVEIDTQKLALDVQGIGNELRAAKARFEVSKQLNQIELQARKADLALKESELKAGRLAELTYEQLKQGVQVLGLNQQNAETDAEKGIADIELRQKVRELDLKNGRLEAPFDGTLAFVLTPKGSRVEAGQTVATLITNTRVVEARISEENMTKGVKEGQHVRVRFTGLDRDFAGKIRTILPAQDAQTLRYIAYLDLDIDPALLTKTGQSGDGVITIAEHEAKVRVPRRAIYNNQVYVVRNGRVEIRRPKPGFDSGGVVEILSGIEPGEEVILDGQDQYYDGQSVRTQRGPSGAK